jgi:hypothetical protein
LKTSNVKNVSDVKVKEQYHFGNADRCAAVENPDDNVDISRA